MEKQASKSALLDLKKELEIIKNGRDILHQKKEILLKEILKILDKVEEMRDRLNEAVIRSYNLLIKAYMEAGRETVIEESKLAVFRGELNVIPKTFLGIPVPEVKFKLYRLKFPLSSVSENIFIDVARQSFIQCVNLILELASIEIKAWKLAEELKKTVIRVNALERYYIPEYEKRIKKIQSALEETEREFLFLLKKISE
ncbi:V/A-type H+-transporting ATPase subunit D [Persephonella hydrogeniphila]|uniref:V/A-type H+-transporting ATPase subunit D n=1 Tax=Persephonella hydrogeniphila TaxID=198703 RepID=A0A285NI69_9AQUI|nr:V-type ATP synthase subunit D [Persephonella hydrogeniphila]SNZ09149.1 V/A-type H+-transporting ATPase subunit D [Persephonella hydrogeniphila]